MAGGEGQSGDMKIEVAPDKLSCSVTVTPPKEGGTAVLPAGAMSRLRQAGIVFGIDEDRLTQIVRQCQEGNMEQGGVIAHGRAAVAGEPARLDVLLQASDATPWTAQGAGQTVSYHFPAPIINAREGQVVAYKTHATSGRKGTDVFGHDVIPPVLPDTTPQPRFRLRVEEDGTKGARYVATEDGEVVIDQDAGTIAVMAEHIVAGDVTPTTGDIIFVRDVVVKGNAVAGSVIRAGGDVTIVGRAEGATVHAEGRIEVSQGIIGGEHGMIQAGGDVVAAFAEHATVRAGGDVHIRRGILNSHVSARGSVYCTQGRGSIIGGVTRATLLIEAKKYGTPASPDCVLIVGSDYVLLERREELQQQIAQCHQNIHKLAHALGPITAETDLSAWPPQVRENIQKAVEQRDKQTAALDQLVAELKTVEQQLASQTGGTVRVLQDAQAGTKVEIRGHSMTLHDVHKYCRFAQDLETEQIVSQPLG